MLPWSIYLSPKWPLDESHVFRYIRSICEKTVEILVILSIQWTGIRKSGIGAFQQHQNESPQLHHFPLICGVENVKLREKSDFAHSNDKTLPQSFPINNFQRQSDSCKCLEGNREKIWCILQLLTTISVHFLATALYSRNGCIDSHVWWYTVEKHIKYSLIGGKFFAQRRNMHPI